MNQVKILQKTEFGFIPVDWGYEKLENHLIIKGRIGWKGLKKAEYVNEGYAIITGENIINESIDWINCGRITRERYDESPEIMLQENDILVTKDGTIGKLAYLKKLKEPATVASHIFVIRNKSSKIIQTFLFYFFKSPMFQYLIESRTEGSVVPALYQRDITQLKIPIPPLPTQRAIAHILGSLDDKIELNRQMNETLDAMARAIFQSWFVDFDPVRAKAEGEQFLGIDAETAALFPECFEDSEIGEIPLGWKIERFGKILQHSTERIGSEQAVEYSATVTGLTLRDKRFNKQLSKTREKNKKIVKGDIIFGLSRKIVNFGLMKGNIGSVSPVYEIFKVSADVYIPELLEMQIRYDMTNYIDILKPSAREGQAIDREYLLLKVVLVPDMRVQKKYFQIYSILQQKIENNEQQSHMLAKIRDVLLPKLMSGEIQVQNY